MILLVVYGERSYLQYAENLTSIIKSNPQTRKLKFQIVTDQYNYDRMNKNLFDVIVLKENSFFYDPCLVKLKLFELSVFQKTLYLDVDAIPLQSIKPLIDRLSKEEIYVQALGSGTYDQNVSYTPWISDSKKWIQHYKLVEDKERRVYGFQTSIIYFDKQSLNARLFFKTLLENYKNKPPKEAFDYLWGQSRQYPDEFFYSVTAYQLKIRINEDIQPLFYPDKYIPIQSLLKNYYFMSQWGNINALPYSFEIYDLLIKNHKIQSPSAKHLYHRKYTSYNGKVY